MNDHDIHRFASALAEIAHALEHSDGAAERIDRVLGLTNQIVPYARIALLDIDELHRQLYTVPLAEPVLARGISASLVRAWHRIADDVDHPRHVDHAPTGLTLPVMGLDRINAIIRVEPSDGMDYDTTHLRLLSVVAAQLGAYLTMTRLRAEQARHTAELATAIEFQQVLAAVVGHDLRSPLSVIITVATMLRDTTTDPLQLRSLERALRSAQRANRLISDLIDVTECRVQGAMPIRRQRTDARRIVEDAVDEARVAHPDHSIELVMFGADVVLGYWDPDRVAEVLSNLINNAVHHGARGVPIHVTLGHDDNMLTLAVHNAGPAIAAHLLPTLFDPFKRGASPREARKHGLGLGLYIVDQITRAHRGRVAVTSRTDEGTTFTITLPREAGVAVPAPAAGALVLVVDDDDDVREGVSALLEKRGYRVAAAVDGQDAYDQLRAGLRPSAILLDLHMPRMDGQTLCDHCTSDPELATIPIIIVSSDVANALKLSRAAAHLPKPVRGSDLLRALDSLHHEDR